MSFGVSPATAQVFGPGPSDSALFDTVINLPPDQRILSEIGGDGMTTQLNVADGGTVSNFFSALNGSEVNISGGNVGDDFNARTGSVVNISGGNVGDSADFDGVVNISGGTVGNFFSAFFCSVVNISGGDVGDNFETLTGSIVNITGGTVGDSARFGSEVNISGGDVGSNVIVFSNGVVNISGGNVGEDFDARTGSAVNLFGSGFLLDGEPLADLVLGEPFTITDRDVTLSGLLVDGSSISFDLNSTDIFGEDFFASDATLTVTLETQFLLGDVDQNGAVDFLDIGPFISLLSNGTFQDEADIDQSGVVDFLDIGPFIGLLSSQ